jgi:hypothetical protein
MLAEAQNYDLNFLSYRFFEFSREVSNFFAIQSSISLTQTFTVD